MYAYKKLSPEERRAVVEDRLARGWPAHQPPHPSRGPGLYLLSAACYQHKHHLSSAERRQYLQGLLAELCEGLGVVMHGWVILTNHYHLMADVPQFAQLAKLFKRLHGLTAYRWNGEEGRRGRKIWFHYSDRLIRSERHYFATLNYIHFNPVRHGHVKSPYEWEASSVHDYLESHGREWLRDSWQRYPVKGFGHTWDEL